MESITLWPGAYDYAVNIKLVLPTRTVSGWMSPIEFITGQIPNLSHFRVWGSKCFVLEPRGEHRKDWHPKSVVGFFLKLSVEPIGYEVWVPELQGVVTAVNVVFDESIPDPGLEYHESLERQLVPTVETKTSINTLRSKYVGKHFVHDESGLLYEVVAIRMLKDRTLVADVKLVGGKKAARQPFHFAEMQRLVDNPVNRDSVIRGLTEKLEVEEAKLDKSGRSRDASTLAEVVNVAEVALVDQSVGPDQADITILGESSCESNWNETLLYKEVSDVVIASSAKDCTLYTMLRIALQILVQLSLRQERIC